MGLNIQQKKINAKENRNHNIIVPASAGTGKTTTLTARIIEYIKEGKDIDNYLIVSFTEPAANELKERISRELKDNLSKDNERHFKNQLAKLPTANISTIHAFCLDVIKRYGYIRNIDPAIAGKLGNEGILKQLQKKAMDKALDYRNNNEIIYVLNDRSENIENITKIIENISKFTQNLDDYDKWKKDLFESYDTFKKKKWDRYPIDLRIELNKTIDELEVSFNTQKMIVERNAKPDSAAVTNFNNVEPSTKQMFKDARKYIDKYEFDKLGRLFVDYDGIPVIHGGIKKEDEADKTTRKYLLGKYKKITNELKDYICFEEVENKTYKYIKKLLEISDNYLSYYDELKKEEDIIDYQDMINIALDILNDNIVSDIYRNKFTEIMVDEYQDTNQLQEKVISAIKKDNNVFRVGDVKQSIYKFQNAKPSLMRSLIEKQGENDIVLPLQFNYRSKANIRNFSNYIFNRLMNIGENSYNKEIDDLLLAPDFKDKDSDGMKIQLVHIPSKREIEGKKDPVALNNKGKIHYICTYISNEICRLKNNNDSIKWSDFVILVRTNKYKATLKRYLNERNVPVFTKAKTGFFSDEAVSCIISILNLILSDSRMHAFNVLTSSMFEKTYEEIAKKEEVLDLNKESKNKESLNYFIQELKEYHENHSLSELLNKIYAKNDYYMKKINSFQRSNLDSLYKLVEDYEKEDNNLKNLVSYLSTYKTIDREEANSFNNKDNVVQIMTIHQSKGLEFKYVFLADFFFKYSADKYNNQLQFNERYGMAIKYTSLPYKVRYPNAYYNLIKKQNQYEDFYEELRLLYVAVTRASYGLYIVGVYKDEYLTLSSEDLFDKSMLTWIETALVDSSQEVLDLYDRQVTTIEMLEDMKVKVTKIETSDSFESNNRENLKIREEISLSPSQLENYYINTLNFDITPGARRGSIMHKAIELLGIKDVKPHDIDKLGLDISKEDNDRIIRFYNNEFTRTLFKNDNYHERASIYLNEFNEASNGIIDLLSVSDKTVYIIDFKSDKNTTKEKLVEKHQLQQNAYYKVVKGYFTDKEVKMYLYSFDLNEYVEVPLMKEQYGS